MSQFSKTMLAYIADTRKEHKSGDRDPRPLWELTKEERAEREKFNAQEKRDRRAIRRAVVRAMKNKMPVKPG